MRSMPMRSGTSPDAMPWAILPTISVCGMYVSLILQSGALAFQAATSMSTMSLLPPERSHIVSSPLLAQPVVADGADGADGRASPDGAVSVFLLHAATSRVIAAA